MRKQALHPRTEVLNKKQQNQSKLKRMDALAWLAKTFPEAFDNTLYIRPLKKGIMNDILAQADKALEAGISKSKLREAVVVYTRRLDYLACLKSKEMRIDLNGNSIERVTAEEAQVAAAKIRKRIEKSDRHDSSQENRASVESLQATNKGESEVKLPVYPYRENGYASHSEPTKPKRAATVVVKHKPSKQYDPNAVARLKEKLGLSRAKEQKKELVNNE